MGRCTAHVVLALGFCVWSALSCAHGGDAEPGGDIRTEFDYWTQTEAVEGAPDEWGSATDPEASDPTDYAAGPMARHRVRPGDTVWGIAQFYGVSSEAILEANDIDDPTRLFVGSELRVPSPNTWTLQSGQTVWSVAHELDVCVEAIIEANAIDDVRRLQVGSELAIPSSPDCAPGGNGGPAPRTALTARPAALAPTPKPVVVASAPRPKPVDVAPAPTPEPVDVASAPPTEDAEPADASAEDTGESDLLRVAAEDALDSAERALSEADYDKALAEAERARVLIEAMPEGTPTAILRSRREVLLGTVHLAFGRDGQAREHFTEAIATHPGLTLDPNTSPKVRRALEEARATAGLRLADH